MREGRRILLDPKAMTFILTAYDKETSMKMENDESLVFSLRYGDVSFLLMGHCLEGCEERLVELAQDKNKILDQK